MRSIAPSLVLVLVLGALTASRAPAQDDDELDLADIFSHESFYEEHDILRSQGPVPFTADVWALPDSGGGTRLLVGASLANTALEFVRTSSGRFRASYRVTATLERDGERVVDESWEKSIDVATFDETGLGGETIVFQSDFGVRPGEHDLTLTIRDLNADEAARTTSEIEVPGFGGEAPALAEPVVLRLRPEEEPGGFVVHPSRYFPTAPERVEFLAEAAGLSSEAGPWELRGRIAPMVSERDEEPLEWRGLLEPGPDGRARTFGAFENDVARFGEYEMELVLVNGAGEEIERRGTPLLIAGTSGWIVENWDDALSLIRYEATDGEMEILEDVEEDQKRVEAWNCFWRMRDPVPATTTNEALQEYFRKLEIANRQWSSTLRPGYLSDRGRVYLTLGPPNDIFERPVPMGQRPFEVWRYDRYNFEILFVDRIGFDNYQIQNIDVYQRELSVIERRKRSFLRERAAQCPLLEPAFE